MESLNQIINNKKYRYVGCEKQDNGKFQVVYRYFGKNSEIANIVFKDVQDPFVDSYFATSYHDFYIELCGAIEVDNPEIKIIQEAEPLQLTLEDIKKKFGRKVEIVSSPKLKEGGNE